MKKIIRDIMYSGPYEEYYRRGTQLELLSRLTSLIKARKKTWDLFQSPKI